MCRSCQRRCPCTCASLACAGHVFGFFFNFFLGGEGTAGAYGGTRGSGHTDLDVERVSAAAGPVALIKVRIVRCAASPGKRGRARRKVLHHLHREG